MQVAQSYTILINYKVMICLSLFYIFLVTISHLAQVSSLGYLEPWYT